MLPYHCVRKLYFHYIEKKYIINLWLSNLRGDGIE